MASNEDFEKEREQLWLKELKQVAYVPEFYKQDNLLPNSERGVSDRMSAGAWNAVLLFQYATDVNCPNSDYFLENLVQWLQMFLSFHRRILKLNDQNEITFQSGHDWSSFVSHLGRIPVATETSNIVDRTHESTIQSRKKEIAAANAVLKLFAASPDQRIQKGLLSVVQSQY